MVVVGLAVVAVLWFRSGAHEVPVEDATTPTGSTIAPAPSVLRPAQD